MFKSLLKKACLFFHLDVTKNIKYDRLTQQILKKHLRNDDNCIDIGCHRGEILDLMLQIAPRGRHYAFEPIPHLYKRLIHKYGQKARVFPYALSDKNGQTTFQFVKNAPAYSGIKRRRYDISNPDISEIEVELKKLDDVISDDEPIHFIKIDVEGGELDVLKGAKRLLTKNKPSILFESGKGSSDYYGATAKDLYHYISNDIGLSIYTLQGHIRDENPLDAEAFAHYFRTNQEYYFIAVNG